ncbi:hypothetical protein GGS20DRAFT_589809 [Poronia punctata]|nr:hypothetical protein GGS20DRAFT_589809 [Poronia punctata]
MSLNGLDNGEVKEAYDVSIAEPGGWFLLKYASRDEIDILDRGTGGIVEIRNAIANYEEPSPLYGFLRYRRRNVVIKYMPDDCSRLVQARAAVHFNAICEQFAHNTTFEIANAKDLKDSKLSAACSLHAASGSTSSSTSSLRRRRLNEIAEEGEEEERDRKRQSVVKEEERPTSSVYSDEVITPFSPESPVVLDRQQISNPQETSFASTKIVPDFTGSNGPTSPAKSESDRRLSSQSSRPDVYSSSSHSFNYGKTKVKLGPRPSLDAHKRPATAESFRPVAALPPGLKLFKGVKKGQPQEHEQGSQVITSPMSEPTAEPLESPGEDDQLPPRPATSSGASVKSMPASSAPVREAKISPEKARLMKAMKLREKRMQDAKSQLLPTEKAAETVISTEAAKHDSDPVDNINIVVPSPELELPASLAPKSEARIANTAVDSHPSSPSGASSTGIGDSTKASSLSELHEEVVQATKALMLSTSESDKVDVKETVDDLVEEISGSDTTIHDKGPIKLVGVTEDKDNNVDQQPTGVSESSQPDPEPAVTLATLKAEAADPVPDDAAVAAPHKNSRLDEGQLTGLSGPTMTSGPSEDSISPTSPISPTGLSLKSRFSRTDVAVPTEPSATTAQRSATVAEHEKPKPPPKTNPEILLPPATLSARPKAAIEPIRTDLPPASSDPLDDDALMEELRTATLQEAKPILVSKSPITPVFPGSSSPPRDARLPRAVSNPMRNSFLMPSEISHNNTARSVSGGAPYLNNLTRQNSNASLQSKKSNVGSTISQRIKALQALSGNASEESRPRPTTPSATFFTVRKATTREPSNSSSVAERAGSVTRQPTTPERSQEATPDPSNSSRERSGSVANRLSMFEGQYVPRGRPESVQVTARIIRGAQSPFSKPSNSPGKSGDSATAEFRQSTLLVDVQRTQSVKAQPQSDRVPLADRPKTSVQDVQDHNSGFESVGKTAKRRTSLSLMKDFIKEHASLANKSTENLASASSGPTSLKSPSQPPSSHQNSAGFGRRMSSSSRRSSITREGDNRTPSRLSESGSTDEDKSSSDKKSGNRTSRFMRRLSNSFGTARKTGAASISATVTEEDADQVEKASKLATQSASASPAVVAFMGDVNVQFPDNLLWKRRSMCLDAQGFLFLSTIQGAAKAGKDSAGTKRFHLSDFRKPYIPDVEVQELPNSVVLDFVEGSSLQVACVDRVGQQNILRTLQEAHETHAAS